MLGERNFKDTDLVLLLILVLCQALPAHFIQPAHCVHVESIHAALVLEQSTQFTVSLQKAYPHLLPQLCLAPVHPDPTAIKGPNTPNS